MIAWHHPVALSALAIVPALLLFFAWAERRRRRDLDRFVASPLHGVVVPDVDPRRRRVRAVLVAGAVGAIAFALAGPLWGFRWERVRREGVDLVIAFDTSRSMLAEDVKPSRLGRAKLAVRDLVAALEGDRVALVAFAGSAFVQCPLTLDYGVFLQSLDALDAGIIPRGGTSLAAALDAGLGALEGREGKHQALIVITDGESHEGDAAAAAKRASERGVKVYTVGMGTTEGELIPEDGGAFLKDGRGQVVKSRLDEETLQRVALETGGAYVHARGAETALADLYRDHIARMEKHEIASTLERRWEHRFQWPLALAVALLVAEMLVADHRALRRGEDRP
jgi:Ca-activated chloride channel family protein